MSDYKDELQNLAQIEDEGERLAAAARLDAIFDDLPDVRSQLTEKEKQIEEIKAAKEAAEVERDHVLHKPRAGQARPSRGYSAGCPSRGHPHVVQVPSRILGGRHAR